MCGFHSQTNGMFNNYNQNRCFFRARSSPLTLTSTLSSHYCWQLSAKGQKQSAVSAKPPAQQHTVHQLRPYTRVFDGSKKHIRPFDLLNWPFYLKHIIEKMLKNYNDYNCIICIYYNCIIWILFLILKNFSHIKNIGWDCWEKG